MDLFGQMPTSKHVVMVQDLTSRFPAAKLVSLTKADKVLPSLEEIYDRYGNPEKQISDNGPPFRSKKMDAFAEKRNIQLQMVPPHHPNFNPAETFMKTLGKAVKTCFKEKKSDEEIFQGALQSYHQTPHPSTEIAPADMLFQNGIKTMFPRKKLTEEQVRGQTQGYC